MASARASAPTPAAVGEAAGQGVDQDSSGGDVMETVSVVCKECAHGGCMQRKTVDKNKSTNPLVLNAPRNCACSLCHGKTQESRVRQGAVTTSMHSLVISTFSSEEDWSFSESEISNTPDPGVLPEEDHDSVISIPTYLYDNPEDSTTPSGEEQAAEDEEHIKLMIQLRRLMQRFHDEFDEELEDVEENDEVENRLKLLSEMLTRSWYSSKQFCEICYEMKAMFVRPCCLKPVCDECMLQYLTTKVESAIVVIECPMSKCSQLVWRDEINARLPKETCIKVMRFLIDLNKEPHKKTCPSCNDVMTIDADIVKKPKFNKKPYVVDCAACHLKWCFPCHAPWHEGFTCKQYRKGDRLLHSWAKQQEQGQVNARRCPSCKVYIQRTSGCAHMKCTKCKTNFCYNCGGRYMGSGYLGRHMDKYSIFGCKYRFKPYQPVQRKLIRGAIFAGKILVTPLIAAVAVGAGAILIATSVFYVPVLVSRKFYKEHRHRKQRLEYEQYIEERKQYLASIRQAGDPYLEQFHRLQQLGYNFRRSATTLPTSRCGGYNFNETGSRDRESVSSSSDDTCQLHRHTVSVQVEAVSEAMGSTDLPDRSVEHVIASLSEVELKMTEDPPVKRKVQTRHVSCSRL